MIKTSPINVTCHKVINIKRKIIFAFTNIENNYSDHH